MQETYAKLIAKAGTPGKGTLGKYESQLSAEDVKMLDGFTAWLKAQADEKGARRFTDNSVNSYRSYVAKALALPDETLTSDQRSAVRKLGEFLQQSVKRP